MKTKEELAEEALKPYECFFNFDLQLKIFGGLVTESLKEISTKPVSLKSVLEKMFLAGYEAGQPKWVSVEDALPEVNEDGESELVVALKLHDIITMDNVEKTREGETIWSSMGTTTHWLPLPTLPIKENEE
jgi:hypothetical protein